MRKFVVGLVVALGAGSLGVLGAGAQPEEKITICHATDSESNPYVVNTPDRTGDVQGHADHTGPIWQPGFKDQGIVWGDIIPPFEFGGGQQFPGLNWPEGQAILENDCKPVTPPPPTQPPETAPPRTAPPVTEAAPPAPPPPPPGPAARPPAPSAPVQVPAAVAAPVGGQPRTTG